VFGAAAAAAMTAATLTTVENTFICTHATRTQRVVQQGCRLHAHE
jgi:hypothetical protein